MRRKRASRRSTRQPTSHQTNGDQGLGSAAGETNGFGLDLPATAADIDRLQNQLDADRAQHQRRFVELESAAQPFDAAALNAHRAWSERQVSLFQVYVDELADRLDELDQFDGDIDSRAAAADLASIHDRLDGAIGEAMTVRIELDRLADQVQRRFDDVSVRLAAVESRLNERVAGGAPASQNERLDEIERALEQLAAHPPTRAGAVDNPAPQTNAAGPPNGADAPPDPLARLVLTLAEADRTGSCDAAPINGAVQPATQQNRTQFDGEHSTVPRSSPPGAGGEASG